MPLPINIADLIDHRIVENARIEYKSDWNPEPILHSICAFANDIDNWGGGYIIIGIEEENGMPKFPVKGLDKSSIDTINKDLLQKCNLIEPRYLPVVEPLIYKGKEILVVWAPGGNNRPYKCPVNIPVPKGAKPDKAYYIRKMSSSLKANQLEERELFLLAGNQPYDDRPNMNASIQDLRAPLLSDFLYAVNSSLFESSQYLPVEETASSMRLLGGPKEALRPLNVGLMFFNERPDNFFPYARIEVVDKPDPTGTGMTEKIFTGPLDKQLAEALSYIRNYIIAERIWKIPGQAEALRVFNYPYEAVEESLANAVYHKSYQIGEPITVMVTPEKMEITSLPGPDRSISDEDLKACNLVSRRYRNRRIGDYLKELKLVEGRNTGIPTILRAMKQNGSESPQFLTDEDRSYFTVRLPVNNCFLTGPETHAEPARKARRTPDETKLMALKLLEESGSMSSSELARALGYNRPTETLSKIIKELLELGLVEYVIPGSKYNRNQKLRKTNKGSPAASAGKAEA